MAADSEVYGLRTTGQDDDFMPMPGYIEMVKAVIPCQLQLLNEIPENFSYFAQFRHFYCSATDASLIFGFALLWTLMRYGVCDLVFKPFYSSLGLTKRNASKAPESTWKMLWYLCSWFYTYDLLFNREYKMFQNPAWVYSGWKIDMVVPFDIYILYMYQLGFYIHSIYATLRMDAIRNDFPIMILHHFVTIFLIYFSYTVRVHRMGMLVLFCHDLTDVFLEAAKIFNYTKERNGKQYFLNEVIANVLFVMFAISWVILRMYWYPLKVLYGGGCFGNSNVPLLTSMNILIWVLQFLNIYWFSLIVKMVFKVVFGCETSFRDTREDQLLAKEKQEEEEKKKKHLNKNNDVHVPNGVDGVIKTTRQRATTKKAD